MTTDYETFAEAAAADEDGDVIKLLKDVGEAYELTDGDTLKVEKDGKVLTVNGAVATTEGGSPVVTTYYADFADAAGNVGLLDVITLVDDNPEPYTLSDGQTLKIKAGDFNPNLVAPEGKALKTETDEQTGITTYSLVDAYYTITYELNGGTNEATNPTGYSAGMAEAIALKDATREYYDFAGWYSDEALTKEVEEIAVGSTGNITLYAKWQDTVFWSGGIEMAEWIAPCALIHLPDGANKDEYSIHVEYHNSVRNVSEDMAFAGKNPTYTAIRGDKQVNCYFFRLVKVASAEMTEVATVTLLHGSTVVGTHEYSVRNICESKLENNANTKQVELYKALLNYGARAQQRYNFNANDLADKNLNPPVQAGNIPNSFAITNDPTNFGQYIKSVTTKLNFETNVRMRVYLTPATGYGLNDFVITVKKDGKVYSHVTEPTMTGGDITFWITDVAANALDEDFEITVTLKGTNNSATWSRSSIRYAYSEQQTSTNQNQVELMKALYLYNQKAEDLFGK